MDRQLKKRIRKLRKELKATKTETRSSSTSGLVEEWHNINYNQGVYDIREVETEPVISCTTRVVSDTEKINKARSELTDIYMSLGYGLAESRVLISKGRLGLFLYRINQYAQEKNQFLEETVARASSLEDTLNNPPSESEEKFRLDKFNKTKTQEALEGLADIYENSEWYSGRFLAGRALGRETPLDTWIDDLEKRMFPFDQDSSPEAAYDSAKLFRIIGNESPQSGRLKKILKKVYQGTVPEMEKVAGTALGYSRLRIFFNEMFRKKDFSEVHGGAGWGYQEDGKWKSGDNR